MAFDLNAISPDVASPEIKKSPEVIKTPEQEAPVQVAQAEQQPAVSYSAPEQITPNIEVPHQVEQVVKIEQDDLLGQVEAILADKKIMEIYGKLPENKKQSFKVLGEKLAIEIRDMIRAHKVKPYKVLAGIRKWLMIIPDIEKYYLLQEAKIDVDQVLALAEEQMSPNAM